MFFLERLGFWNSARSADTVPDLFGQYKHGTRIEKIFNGHPVHYVLYILLDMCIHHIDIIKNYFEYWHCCNILYNYTVNIFESNDEWFCDDHEIPFNNLDNVGAVNGNGKGSQTILTVTKVWHAWKQLVEGWRCIFEQLERGKRSYCPEVFLTSPGVFGYIHYLALC